ncbi:MAG TPA: glycerol-3-phosphate 1-O-acyltransferase PlsY [Bacteroidales bacterium]|nr:glycerol-3-phosphate 1-O-acyltransferase PlsY [Bacteroidales bacterium]HSA43790.1 glycerol-3-phosphate 1-O-acyltransferase PlsY [Bacteroidales bacterium]
MLFVLLVLSLILAYLLGSIPSAVWIGRFFFGVDVRESGSRNAGATNSIRVLGTRAGIAVLVLDMLKGYFAVSLTLFFSGILSPEFLSFLRVGLAVSAILGHVFPVFAGFRGGKGVATLAGVMIAMLPASLLVALGVFVLVFVLSHYVSLASITAALAFPFIVMLVFGVNELSLQLFSILTALFVPLTHLKNIRRLLIGNENKFQLRKRKNI